MLILHLNWVICVLSVVRWQLHGLCSFASRAIGDSVDAFWPKFSHSSDGMGIEDTIAIIVTCLSRWGPLSQRMSTKISRKNGYKLPSNFNYSSSSECIIATELGISFEVECQLERWLLLLFGLDTSDDAREKSDDFPRFTKSMFLFLMQVTSVFLITKIIIALFLFHRLPNDRRYTYLTPELLLISKRRRIPNHLPAK